MAVTKEQIFKAADQIAANGQRPTLDAVRKIVGGSYTTISPALKEWKSQKDAAPLSEPPPQVVTDKFTAMGADIWAAAMELANSRLTAEREALEKDRVDMQATQTEVMELADRLADEIKAWKRKCEEMEARANQAEKNADELKAQLAAARDQAHTADVRAVEIERRADELRAELDRSHQVVDDLRAIVTSLTPQIKEGKQEKKKR